MIKNILTGKTQEHLILDNYNTTDTDKLDNFNELIYQFMIVFFRIIDNVWLLFIVRSK